MKRVPNLLFVGKRGGRGKKSAVVTFMYKKEGGRALRIFPPSGQKKKRRRDPSIINICERGKGGGKDLT